MLISGPVAVTARHVFAWESGAWSECSAECGGGTQTRSVACRDESGNTVDALACDPGMQPPTEQACNTQACATFSWWVGEWSECSVACGGGVRTRHVTCQDQSGTVVARGAQTLASGGTV